MGSSASLARRGAVAGPARVLVASAGAAARTGIRLVLDPERFFIAAEAETAQDAVEAATFTQLDVCVVDAALPGDGIAAASQITAAPSPPAVVVLTERLDEDEALRAIRAGVFGYLRKDMDAQRLSAALDCVLAGEAALPRALVARLLDEVRGRGRRRHHPLLRERGINLTAREWDVVDGLAEGATTAEIAGALSISPVTVRRHLAEVVRKLGAPNRDSAVRLLRQHAGSRRA